MILSHQLVVSVLIDKLVQLQKKLTLTARVATVFFCNAEPLDSHRLIYSLVWVQT